ncbi:MAG TPA: sigma-70 family RNA polymerase sigma factor [Stellaceae bacterium]|nr:sigma-70 family RNA polymerase sigma factor [Stellaceae bacterium]
MTTVDRLVRGEIPRLNRYARALMRGRDGAEDLVQDTILRALEKAHLWQPGTNLQRWLFTLMHNQYVNLVRRSARQKCRVDLDRASTVAPPTQLEPLMLRDFDRAMARLPEEQRRVVRLVGIDGLRYDEAAAVCGVPVGTIRSRLCRAREALQAMVDPGETMLADRRRGPAAVAVAAMSS